MQQLSTVQYSNHASIVATPPCNSPMRRTYDQRVAVGDAGLRVSHDETPGALALMQELGHFEVVIASATTWLRRSGSQGSSAEAARDVAHSLSLALYGRSEAALQEGRILPACDDLERALALMKRSGRIDAQP